MKLNYIHKQITEDTLTPVSVCLTLRDHFTNVVLLESNAFEHEKGNFSIIACDPIKTITAIGKNSIKLIVNKNVCEKHNLDIKLELINFIKSFSIPELELNIPNHGIFGYISNDITYVLEPKLNPDESKFELPLYSFSFYKILIVFDHYKQQIHSIIYDEDKNSIIENQNKLFYAFKNVLSNKNHFSKINRCESILSDKELLKLFEKAKKHCQRGDIFQVVLSKRLKQKFMGDEFEVYRHLRQLNPSPYLFFFDFGDFKLFGSSPEAQLLIKKNKAEIHPIAGTRKLKHLNIENVSLEKELLTDPKENSEHVMLVDLARNDLSKSADNVKVSSFKQIEKFSHVMHIVSKVTGDIQGIDKKINLIFDTFPAGTLSGAPKFKALSIINKNEPELRNFYGGTIGFIDLNGNCNMAILIRSVLSRKYELHYQAGAGIVINSQPQLELKEIYNKLKVVELAIENASSSSKHIKEIKHENTFVG
ncbi:MAG: anthranilate synthase component I family protein [Bacteroidia bacterium]